MAVQLTVNGVTYNYPELSDEGWGPDGTNWAVAITQGVLTKAGGLFSLTSDIDFGPNFGLKSVYYKTRSANIATAGQFRLSNSDVISFRNLANSANINFGAGSSDAIPSWGGIDLVNLSTAQILSNKTFAQSLIPTINNTFDVGSSALRWKDGWFAGNVTIAGTLNAGSVTFTNITTVDLTATGNTIIGDANTDTVAINADIISNLRPDVTATYDIGSSTNRWRDIYVSRDAYLGRSLHGNGTAGSPSISFESDTGLGIYRDSGSSMELVAGGVNKLQITLTQLTPTVPVRPTLGAGSASTPHFSFSSDPDTGMYDVTDNTLGFSTGGTPRLIIRDTVIEGQAGIPFSATNGSAASPSYQFTSEPSTGIFRPSGGALGISILGTQRVQFDASAITSNIRYVAPNGALGAPAYSFSSELTSGMWLNGPGSLNLTVAGANYITMDSSRIGMGFQVQGVNGSLGTPTYSFLNDPDTGIYSSAANQIAVTAGATEVANFTSAYLETFFPIRTADGAVGAPGFAFRNETNTGFYRISGGDVGLSILGALKADWSSSQNTNYQPIKITGGQGLVLNNSGNTFAITVDGSTATGNYTLSLPAAAPVANTFLKYNGSAYVWSLESFAGDISNGGNSFGSNITIGTNDAFNLSFETNNVTRLTINQSDQLLNKDGLAATPSYSYINDPDTGMYRSGSGIVSIASNGADTLIIQPTNIRAQVPFYGQDGTAVAPTYTFLNESNTGFFRSGSLGLGITVGGLLAGQFNTNLALELTNAALRANNGTVSAPSISFISDTGLGIYRDSGASMELVAGGANKLQITTTQLTPFVAIRSQASAGSSSSPHFSFNSDPDTGMYNVTANILGFSTNGVPRLLLKDDQVEAQSGTSFRAPDGSAATPSYGFTNETGLGMYRRAANSGALVQGASDFVRWGGTATEIANFPLTLINGTISAPSLAFTAETGLGLYRPSANQMSVVSNGSVVAKFSDTEILTNKRINNILGSPSAPSYTFQGDEDTGLYANITDGTIGFSSNGASTLQLSSTLARFLEPIGVPDGNDAAPSYVFTSDVSTGIGYFGAASGRIRFSALGTKVAEINPSGVQVINGSAALPSLSFLNDTSSGLYRISGSDIGLSVGGTLKADWSSSQNTNFQPVKITGGQGLVLNNSGNTFATTIAGAPVGASYTITLPSAAPGANTALTYNGASYVWNAVGSPVVNSVTLSDNTTNGTVTTFVSATTNVVFVKYSLKRSTTNFQVGELKIVNDGTTPQIVDTNLPISDCGTTFSVDISGANLRLLYTTTSTGNTVAMKYTVESWAA